MNMTPNIDYIKYTLKHHRPTSKKDVCILEIKRDGRRRKIKATTNLDMAFEYPNIEYYNEQAGKNLLYYYNIKEETWEFVEESDILNFYINL